LPRIDVTLCAILDGGVEAILPLEDFTRSIIEGGVTCIQVRCKESATRDVMEFAGRVMRIACRKDVPVIVNDRADIAMALGAQGVHVGETDLPVEDVRRICGAGMVIGVTVRDPESARSAEAHGADYVGVGPFFATPVKPGLRPIPAETVRAIKSEISLPILAIGGINETNAALPVELGASGVAVISALRRCPNPKEVASRLRHAIDQAKKR
jgi:thiamine-phosphate pyrophosphorylase